MDCMGDPRKTYGEMAGLWGSAKTYGETAIPYGEAAHVWGSRGIAWGSRENVWETPQGMGNGAGVWEAAGPHGEPVPMADLA